MIVTVFTPTYNRAKLLPRLYKSLLQQNTDDFEWLIVDDGSDDDTALVVSKMIAEEKISIRYIKQNQSGKHVAYNTALQYASGKLFICVDSDDILAENAIQILKNSYGKLRETDCGFIGYKLDQNGARLSGDLPKQVDSYVNIFNCIHAIGGEFTLVFVTDIARHFLFPVIKDEKFMGESILYDRLDLAGYTIYPIASVLEICEYQPEGLTNNLNRIMRQNPGGYCLYFMQRIDMQTSWKQRLIIAGKYRCFSIFAGNKRSKYTGNHKFFVALSTPLGLLFWLYYKLFREF